LDLELKGKRVIVTGGSKGIGKAILDKFVEEGASIATCARGPEALENALDSWKQNGVKAYGEALDVTDSEKYASWFSNSVEFLGGLDIFISNVSTRNTETGEQRWRRAFEVDFMQHVLASEQAIPYLKESAKEGQSPAFVFVSSIASVMANIMPIEHEYGVMKAALNGYSSQLAHRLAGDGIRSNFVTPGPIDFEGGFWDQVKQADPAMFERVSKMSALQRHGTPEEVANAVVFLASPAASYITGANLKIDGGTLKQTQF
jgi:NAD(P)-dependent dehydrogenase (short-subunit alcohol dehydrogenase family)